MSLHSLAPYAPLLLYSGTLGAIACLFAVQAQRPSPRRRYARAAVILALLHAFIGLMGTPSYQIIDLVTPLSLIVGIAMLIGGIFRKDAAGRLIGSGLMGWSLLAPELWRLLLERFALQ